MRRAITFHEQQPDVPGIDLVSAVVDDDVREERRHDRGPDQHRQFDATFNNASFQPLPVIKNMPVGAPIPPNTGVTLSPPLTVG